MKCLSQKSENVSFKKLQVEGFVDLGVHCLRIQNQENKQLADNALVLIFRSYRSSWIKPIEFYASKAARKGEILTELVDRAINTFDLNDAIVKMVVYDGAKSKKSVMKLLGVGGKLNRK